MLSNGFPFIGYRGGKGNVWYSPCFASSDQSWSPGTTLKELIADFSRDGRSYRSFSDNKEAMKFFYEKYKAFHKFC